MTESKDGVVVGYKPVHFKKRLINHVVDYVCTYVLIIIMSIFITTYGFVSNILVIFSTIVFYFIFENFWQKTPGKWITKTKVVSLDGSTPTQKQILIRSLSRFVPFEVLSFLNNKNPFGWHDKWAKTTVVPDEYTADNVKSIDWVELKKSNKRSVVATIIITLIIIAIIGIMASIALQSLVKAREKANIRMMNQNQNVDSSLRDVL